MGRLWFMRLRRKKTQKTDLQRVCFFGGFFLQAGEVSTLWYSSAKLAWRLLRRAHLLRPLKRAGRGRCVWGGLAEATVRQANRSGMPSNGGEPTQGSVSSPKGPPRGEPQG